MYISAVYCSICADYGINVVSMVVIVCMYGVSVIINVDIIYINITR